MKNRFLSLMIIVAMALGTVGCGGNNNNSNQGAATGGGATTESVTVTEFVEGTELVTVLGEGTTVFVFTVMDGEGNEAVFEIHTEKEIVGEALMELGLIEGEAGDYGLFVKTVNGITVDYDADGAYWAFYINGEYAMAGVDTTPITEGETYMFKVEKA